MDLFSAHYMRQREQSTWVWTEHATANGSNNQADYYDEDQRRQDRQEGGGEHNVHSGKGSKGIAASTNAGTACFAPRSPPENATSINQQEGAEGKVQPCCCETLEHALVTIDVLRSKLVSGSH